MRRYTFLAMLAVILWVTTDAAAATPKTIQNLKDAYIGESTASAKYLAYAARADKEGQRQAARLFRAASRAESYHARNHKAVLVALGVTKTAPGAYKGKPGSTAQNLQDAIKGESYERDRMYPAMIKDAEAEKQDSAVLSMTYALDAEKEHAALFTATLKKLGTKSAQTDNYYVCQRCGATIAGRAPYRCPNCGAPREKFTRVG